MATIKTMSEHDLNDYRMDTIMNFSIKESLESLNPVIVFKTMKGNNG